MDSIIIQKRDLQSIKLKPENKINISVIDPF